MLLKLKYEKTPRRELFYPDNETSQLLVDVMHRKGFTRKDLQQLKKIGFEIEVGVKQIEVPVEFRNV